MPPFMPDTPSPNPFNYSRREGYDTCVKLTKLGVVILIIGIVSGLITYLISMIFLDFPFITPFSLIVSFVGILLIIAGMGRRFYFYQ
jgi:hypothetical protein